MPAGMGKSSGKRWRSEVSSNYSVAVSPCIYARFSPIGSRRRGEVACKPRRGLLQQLSTVRRLRRWRGASRVWIFQKPEFLVSLVACEREFAEHHQSLTRTYKPTSDGSVAAITAGGELHRAANFGITGKSMSRRDTIVGSHPV